MEFVKGVLTQHPILQFSRFFDIEREASENFTSENVPSIRFLGFPRASSRVLKFELASCKCVSEEFVRKSLIASPFMKPRFTPGG